MRVRGQKLTLVILGIGTLAITACLQSKPKVLGKNKPTFNRSDSANSNSFKFNFAFRDSTAAAPDDRTIYIQGSANSKTPIMSTCNSAGTNCVCEFLDSSGAELEETDASASEISYDQTGNYLRCDYDGVIANLASVRVRNQNSTVTSSTLTVDTSLTAQKLIGDDLDVNLVRTIYRYECLFNYLQKQGTTTTSFDCSNQGSTCWNTAAPAASGDLCILQSEFPYYLYSDNYSTNISQKVPDRLYNQGNSSTICGVQIRQFDCASSSGTPVAQFGLFAQQVGIFDTAVQLSASPDASAITYGFAAKTSTFQGNTVCPPGMQRRVFYTATTAASTTFPAPDNQESNYPSGSAVKEIMHPVTPTFTSFEVVKLRGAQIGAGPAVSGDCDGTNCTLPTVSMNTITSFSYVSAGAAQEFCVIPTTLLP
jgi:hypothetical protein